YRDVVGEAVRENVKMVEELRAVQQPAKQKLAMLIQRLMESYEVHYPYLYVFVQENMAHMEDDTAWNREIKHLSRRFNDAVRGIIQKALDEGSLGFPVKDARFIANGIIGMCNWS